MEGDAGGGVGRTDGRGQQGDGGQRLTPKGMDRWMGSTEVRVGLKVQHVGWDRRTDALKRVD